MLRPDRRARPFLHHLSSDVGRLAKIASAYCKNDSAGVVWHDPSMTLFGPDDAPAQLAQAMAQHTNGAAVTVLRVDSAVLTHTTWTADKIAASLDVLAVGGADVGYVGRVRRVAPGCFLIKLSAVEDPEDALNLLRAVAASGDISVANFDVCLDLACTCDFGALRRRLGVSDSLRAVRDAGRQCISVSDATLTALRCKAYNKFAQSIESTSVRTRSGDGLRNWIKPRHASWISPEVIAAGLTRVELTFDDLEVPLRAMVQEVEQFALLVVERSNTTPISYQWSRYCDVLTSTTIVVQRRANVNTYDTLVCRSHNSATRKLVAVQNRQDQPLCETELARFVATYALPGKPIHIIIVDAVVPQADGGIDAMLFYKLGRRVDGETTTNVHVTAFNPIALDHAALAARGLRESNGVHLHAKLYDYAHTAKSVGDQLHVRSVALHENQLWVHVKPRSAAVARCRAKKRARR